MEILLRSQIEALLFAAGEPVPTGKLAKFLKASDVQIKSELEKLGSYYQESGSGLALIFKNDQVQLVSAKEMAEDVAKFLNKEMSEELSTAAAEVLAVVAYRGPLTRAQIEQIRGVNCSFTLRNLAIRGLVERKDNPTDSRSYLYEVSFDFLKNMGLNRIEDLPDYQQLHQTKVLAEQGLPDKEPETKLKENEKVEDEAKDN